MSMICKTCELENPIENFYGYEQKNGKIKYIKNCKSCMIIYRKEKYIPKVHGWAAIPIETKKTIIEDMKNRDLTMKAIAEKHNINYNNLLLFRRLGQIKLEIN